MKKLFLTIFTVFVAASGYLMAQSVELENVTKSKFTGVYPIFSDKDESIKGYYTYYQLEKAKGVKTIEFAVMDKELKKTIKLPIEMHKYADINNIIFNGKYFLISHDDVKNKKSVFNVIDQDGKIFKNKEFTVEKKFQVGTAVYPAASGDGFYVVKNIYNSKGDQGYSIEKVDNSLNQVWIKENVELKTTKAVADLINTTDRFVIWEEVTVKSKIKPMIVCYNAKTGEKIYERDGYDGSSTILYNQLRIDADGGLLAGGAYVDKENYSAVNNHGIYILKLDARGKEVLYSKVSNSEKIQSVLKAVSSGFSVGSKDKVYVEDMIIEGDNIVVISEMFAKNLNATPNIIQQARDIITGKFIGYAGDDHGKATIEINDFILFKFNQKGELTEIKPIAKEEKNKITVWYPYAGLGGQQLAKVLDNLGWFDYGFTTTGTNGSKLMVCSNNAKPRKPEIYVYNLSQNFAQVKVNLKQEAKIDLEKSKVGYFKTIVNEGGKMAVVYYQPKIEKITINLEQIENR